MGKFGHTMGTVSFRDDCMAAMNLPGLPNSELHGNGAGHACRLEVTSNYSLESLA